MPHSFPTRRSSDLEVFHALEEPTSLNTMELLPRLKQAGVAAVKIEGRQRGQAYVRSVTRTWRKAIDRLAVDEAGWQPLREWKDDMSRHAEGHQTTLGPYHRSWHCGNPKSEARRGG